MGFTENLQAILKARYGKDVRQSIHDGIKACMDTIKVGLNEYDIRLSGAEKEHEDMKSEYQEPVKIAKEMRATDISLEIEEGYYWYMVVWGVNGKPKRSIHKIQGDEEISTYLQNVVLPVSPGEKYRIECAKFKPGHLGANVISYPIIAVEQVDHESASGYCGSMSEATDGVAIYDYVVPENANYLLVSHVQQPSNMDIVFRITQLFDTAKEYIQNIAGTPEEYQEKFSGAAAHNAIYRGKYLGDTVTDAQAAAIADGNFNDLYVGDYWTIGGVNYRIADLNYWKGIGNGTKCTTNHVVIVPDTILNTGKMNNTATVSGGYINSLMKSKTLNTLAENLPDTLKNRLLTHDTYISDYWMRSSVDLLSERMIYGCKVLSNETKFSEVRQLNLFRMDTERIVLDEHYWLRDVVSNTNFAVVNKNGFTDSASANGTFGIRPIFAITGD